MKAIETTGQIDKEGNLHLSKPLLEKDKKVKVIVLVPEGESEEEELLWVKTQSKNPAFSFLEDPAEDIYSLKDGKPFHD
jgi:succinyl-CoA synthetase alpha subunit